MKVYTVNIGQVVTHQGRAQYNCFGLGSCIGLFLHDRQLGLTGAAHILLPDAERGPDTHGWYCADDAIAELVRRFQQHGSSLAGLSAKMVGGANTLGTTETGAKNVQSVMHHLRKRNIFIAATDVGGTLSRTAQFETTTGTLTVRRAGNRTGMIF
ncbi:MAG: chemotaxis protein CheD [Chryseolinea sp.]